MDYPSWTSMLSNHSSSTALYELQYFYPSGGMISYGAFDTVNLIVRYLTHVGPQHLNLCTAALATWIQTDGINPQTLLDAVHRQLPLGTESAQARLLPGRSAPSGPLFVHPEPALDPNSGDMDVVTILADLTGFSDGELEGHVDDQPHKEEEDLHSLFEAAEAEANKPPPLEPPRLPLDATLDVTFTVNPVDLVYDDREFITPPPPAWDSVFTGTYPDPPGYLDTLDEPSDAATLDETSDPTTPTTVPVIDMPAPATVAPVAHLVAAPVVVPVAPPAAAPTAPYGTCPWCQFVSARPRDSDRHERRCRANPNRS